MNKHFQKYYICYNSLEEIIRKSFIDIQNLAFFFFLIVVILLIIMEQTLKFF